MEENNNNAVETDTEEIISGLGGNVADNEEIQNDEQKDDSDVEKNTDNKSELFADVEKYDYKDVKLPEGMQLDNDLLEKFNPIAKELGLSQKGANKLMSLAVDLIDKRANDFKTFAQQAQEAQIAKYEKMLTEDKEIGGNNLNATLKVANVAYEAFANDDVKALMEQTGLNKHPAFIKMFNKLGKMCVDDRITISNNPATTEKTAGEILYPNMPSTRKN